jgi:hypothetical protein
MDIRKFSATAEFTAEVETRAGVEKLIFKVRPLPQFKVAEYKDQSDTDRLVSLLMDAVVDWNLELDGQKITCDEENKKKYLPALFDIICVNGKTIGTEILTFCGDSKSFFGE